MKQTITITQVRGYLATGGYHTKRIKTSRGAVLLVHPDSPIVDLTVTSKGTLIYLDKKDRPLPENEVPILHIPYSSFEYEDGDTFNLSLLTMGLLVKDKETGKIIDLGQDCISFYTFTPFHA